MAADTAWRVTGFVLRVSSWFYLACVENNCVSGCWTSFLMDISAFKSAKVVVWFQLECAPEQLVSVVTANRHFYVAPFFLGYPNLIVLLLEHVVFSNDLDFCLWEMLHKGGS